MQYNCPNKGDILQITFLFDTRINLISCQQEEMENAACEARVHSSFDLAQDERMNREGQVLKDKVFVLFSIANLLRFNIRMTYTYSNSKIYSESPELLVPPRARSVFHQELPFGFYSGQLKRFAKIFFGSLTVVKKRPKLAQDGVKQVDYFTVSSYPHIAIKPCSLLPVFLILTS
jgi:hypothetical protein